MRILYLSELNPNGKYGGALVEKRNLKILSQNYDIEKVSIYANGRNFISKVWDLIFSKVPTLYSRSQVKKICHMIKNSEATFLFLETSKMGYFAKVAKKYNKIVVTFLHNCEVVLYGSSRGRIFVPFIKKQEKLTVYHSDFLIYLNERDKSVFNRIYPVTKNIQSEVLPITFEDIVTKEKIVRLQNKKRSNRGLFFGSNFPPNYNGINWFSIHVAPYIDCEIDVVGLNFDNCSELARKNVHVIGTVDKIEEWIMNADFVVFPIFEGSGMKVKTCEALMYGKKIFASNEACEGYILNGAIDICNTAEEFINSINSFIHNYSLPIYNEKARNLFLSHYSDNMFEEKLISIFDRLMLKEIS